MQAANNKGAGHTVWMHRLISTFVVRIWHKAGFLMMWLICIQCLPINLGPVSLLFEACYSTHSLTFELILIKYIN